MNKLLAIFLTTALIASVSGATCNAVGAESCTACGANNETDCPGCVDGYYLDSGSAVCLP